MHLNRIQPICIQIYYILDQICNPYHLFQLIMCNNFVLVTSFCTVDWGSLGQKVTNRWFVENVYLKIELWNIVFQLLNLHLWQAAYCTLHTAQHTVCTAPKPENTPESQHVRFILQIENCTLHTTCLHCIFQMYHFELNKESWPVFYSTFTWQNVHWCTGLHRRQISKHTEFKLSSG